MNRLGLASTMLLTAWAMGSACGGRTGALSGEAADGVPGLTPGSRVPQEPPAAAAVRWEREAFQGREVSAGALAALEDGWGQGGTSEQAVTPEGLAAAFSPVERRAVLRGAE